MRPLPLLALSLALSFTACTGDDAATTTDTATTATDTVTATTTPTLTSTTSTTSESTTSESTSTTSESTSTTSESSTSESSTSGGDTMSQLCGSGEEEPGAGTNLMEEWGSPCTEDADCSALGDGAECLDNILDIYLLPKGYCAKPCSLPDDLTKYVEDDPTCSADGGITCLGQLGFFEICAIECTSDDECQRNGYTCQNLPQIGAAGDPKFCLMAPNCTQSCVDDPKQAEC